MDTEVKTGNRFEVDASRYAAYLATPDGRLRADLTFANLQEFLPALPEVAKLRALDLGGGTGAAAVTLARLGVHVTLLDSSPAMLALAEQAAAKAGFSARVTVRHGDAIHMPDIFQPRSFDLILCHNLLEYVDDPSAVVRASARLLSNPSAIFSVLVRSQAGEVVKAALKSGDLVSAEENLSVGWAQESLYGGKLCLFTPEKLEALLAGASLKTKARRGVRVVSDYLPEEISRSTEYERIFSLERKLGSRPEFFGVARYMHILAISDSRRSEAGE